MPQTYLSILGKIAAGEWDLPHQQIQTFADPCACRIHAYLHRLEGDLDNAAYWYARANMPFPNNSLTDEFDCLNRMAQINQPG